MRKNDLIKLKFSQNLGYSYFFKIINHAGYYFVTSSDVNSGPSMTSDTLKLL